MSLPFHLFSIAARSSPQTIARWLLRKLKTRRTAKKLPGWERWHTAETIAAAAGQDSFAALVTTMRRSNPFPGLKRRKEIRATIRAMDTAAIDARAVHARARQVDFLGSGLTQLSTPIDWSSDFISGAQWPLDYSGSLAVNDLDHPSDIKIPWELSRLQWLLPVGQRYVLHGDETDAEFTRQIIEEWWNANPVCRGPNWICAMDVALRAVSMTWLFHACKDSPAWRDQTFLERFAKSLLVHGRFIEGNLEFSDVNGNHLAADLAGLTVIGIALGGNGLAEKWLSKSWTLIVQELPEQVPADGVCREGSLAYHRLVAELFLLPALARQNVGLDVPQSYIHRLRLMGDVTNAIISDGHPLPNWGDADDGRALPLGTQAINDHRYLIELLDSFPGHPKKPVYDETLWWLGPGTAAQKTRTPADSASFADAGVFVMRSETTRVFVDAGPVGMAGRGGHGHNDCLSLDLSIHGVPLILDPGCYTYTADWQARNAFRSTSAHNTPQVDDQEINRFTHPRHLWRLRDDAKPEIRHWSTSDDVDLLVAAHTGYRRLQSPVTPVRAVMLDKPNHTLFVVDGFDGQSEHTVRIPFTVAPEIDVVRVDDSVFRLKRGEETFLFVIAAPNVWRSDLEKASVSPSYGILQDSRAIVLKRDGLLRPSGIAILPENAAPPNPSRWLRNVIDGRFPVPGIDMIGEN